MISRRHATRLLAHFSLLPALHLRGSEIDRIANSYTGALTASRNRRYRADAVVSFLGLTIFSRSGVGAADLRVEERQTSDGVHTTHLRFMAGSTPERTRGLNRMGYIQELVAERNSSLVESAYFGFITSNPEKSLDQARSALGPPGKDAVLYAAAEGWDNAQQASFRLYNTQVPSRYSYPQCEEVVTRIRSAVSRSELAPVRSEQTRSANAARTFLYVVRQAMAHPDARIDSLFLYNGKQYRLQAEKNADTKMGREFAARKMPVTSDRVIRLDGTIQNVATRESTRFRLWFERTSDLPIRFEYKPRSFLQLSFDWLPDAAGRT